MHTRRRFLQATAACASLSTTLLASQPTRQLIPSLGFSLYGMKSLTLDDALKTCAQIGYQHVELALNDGYPSHPASFTPQQRKACTDQLHKLKLALPGLMVNMSLVANTAAHQTNLVTIASAGQIAHELVPDNPPIIETVLGGNPNKWDEQKGQMVDQLRDWAKAAQSHSSVLAIKAHVRSAVCTPERLLWLREQVESSAIQLAYDYSHFELQGIDLKHSLELLLPHCRFIHVKDTEGDADKFQFLLPGQGRTDYRKYFSLLREYKYSGPVCVEVSSQVFNQPDYQPVAAAQQCFSALNGALTAAFE